MKDILNLAVVNFSPVWGDKAANLKRICEYAEAAGRQGVQMLVFPETALTGYDIEPESVAREDRMHRRLAETVPGPATDLVSAIAKRYNICGRDVTSWFMGGSSIIGPSTTMTEAHYYAGKPFLADGADENGVQSAAIDLSDTRHSFLDCVWAGGIGKGDWKPEKYIEWYREAQEKNFWGKEPQQ